MASVRILLQSISLCVVAAESLWHTVLLDGEPEDGARCLDGTPARFWIQQAHGANSTKWSFHLMGGGNCASLDDCAARAYNHDQGACYLGSSSEECFNADPQATKPFAPEMSFTDIPSCKGARWCGGLMTDDPAYNPLTWDWNKVFVQYCDGGMWMGNNASVTWVNYKGERKPLYFRGFRNADAVLTKLIANFGLDQGTDLILGGDSSGGIGTLWLADHFRQRLAPFGVRFHAVPDHGFFFEDNYWISHGYDWRGILHWTFDIMNGSAGVNQACLAAALAKSEEPAEFCTLPATSTPYIKTPLFMVNSRYDPMWEADASASHAETNRMGEKLMLLFNETVLDREGNAAFITACSEHCGQWAQHQKLAKGNDDFQVYIDGWSAASAVNAWYGNLTTLRLWVQPGTYPCNSCCNVQPLKSMVTV